MRGIKRIWGAVVFLLLFVGCEQNTRPVHPTPEREERGAAADINAEAPKNAQAETPENAQAETPENAQAETPENAQGLEAKTQQAAEAETQQAEETKTQQTDGLLGILEDYSPLTPSQREVLDAIAWDMPPEVLDAILPEHEGKHFLRSDEKHPELFRESIADLGGIYIGVGTDQGYVFAGWQKPHLAFLVDYDPWVVATHRLYMLFWQACDDGACLMSYFKDREKGMAYLKGESARAARLSDDAAIQVYKEARRKVCLALTQIKRMEAPNFMTDRNIYQYIKRMIETGRMRTYQTNLLGDRSLSSMAKAFKTLGVGVTTLYLSNAEQYWGYSQQFKDNILNLPFAEHALIMRTSATYPLNQDYRYSIQPASVFQSWLTYSPCKGVRHVTRRVPVTAPDHFPFVVDDQMPPLEKK